MSDTDKVRLLVWNDADVRANLDDVLVVEPTSPPQIDLEAIYLWFEARCAENEDPIAIYVTTVTPGQEAAQSEAITAIREQGFGVLVKRSGPDGTSPDLSSAIADQIERVCGNGAVTEVLVANHDAAILARLEAATSDGTSISVIGFRERCGFAADSEIVGFVDVEEITDIFDVELPRTNIFDIPDEGLVLPPLRAPRSGSTTRATAAPTAADTTPVAAQDEPIEDSLFDDGEPESNEPESNESTDVFASPALEVSAGNNEPPEPLQEAFSPLVGARTAPEPTSSMIGSAMMPPTGDTGHADFPPPPPPMGTPPDSAGLFPRPAPGRDGGLDLNGSLGLDPNRPGRVAPPDGSND